MNRILTVACILLGPWGAAGQASDQTIPKQIEVKIKYKVGEVTRYEIVSKAVGSMQMPQPIPEQKFSQTYKQEMVMKCIKVNADGSAVFDVTMPRIGMDMSIGPMKMSWHSDRVDADEPASETDAIPLAIFKAMTRMRCTLTLGPDGKPRKVEGLTEGFRKILNEAGGDKLSGHQKQFFEEMGEWMSNNQMMEHMESGHRIGPPEGVVRIGDKWERTWEQQIPPFNRTMRGKGEYELVGFEEFHGRLCARIRIKESMDTASNEESIDKPAEKKTPFDLFQLDIKVTSGSGVAHVDIKTWDLVQLRQTQNLTITISMPPDPDAEHEKFKKGIPTLIHRMKTSASVTLIEESKGAGNGAKASASVTAPAGKSQ